MLIVNDWLRIPLRELKFEFSRSSGPGGQNVNKVNTKATLRWPVRASRSLPDDVRERLIANCRRRVTRDGDLLITSQRFRDRGRNVADCTEKLRALLLAAAVAPRRRKPTRPTRSSLERRREAKQRISKQKRLRRVPPRDGD
jgi:ribosome-associated protein